MFSLNEALEVVKNKPEFAVNFRDFGTVIDYIITTPSSFVGETEHETMILRNLRGTCFDTNGEIISLALEKFHNLGECAGWMAQDIDFAIPNHVLQKLDGSMIRMIRIGAGYRLGTRAGITDYSDMAERFIKQSPLKEFYDDFLKNCTEDNLTPIFEYTSRENQVVIDYPKSALTLLAIRDNVTGAYMAHESLSLCAFGLPIVETVVHEHSSLSDLATFVKSWQDAEGVVVTFQNGFRVKIKADQYCLLHRSLDVIQHEKNVLELVLTGKLDDLLPLVSDERRDRLERYSASVLENVQENIKEIDWLYNDWVVHHAPENPSGAEYAAWAKAFAPLTPFLFSLKNKGKSGFMEHLIRNCSSSTTVESIRLFIGPSFKDF